MCDEREQLIEYLYGESDDATRQRIEAHLTECHVCRAEVGGLRQLRDDLLAWDVPPHEPIWRPAAPTPQVPMWRRMPGWALAAAASIIFAAGAAGGVATRMWMPAATLTMQQPGVLPMTDAAAVAAAVTPADLEALESSILQRVRQEVQDQIRDASFPEAPVTLAGGTPPLAAEDVEALFERIAAIEQWKDDQIMLNAIFNGQFGRLNSRTSTLTEQVELSRMQRAAFDMGGQ